MPPPTLAAMLDQWTVLPVTRALVKCGVSDIVPENGSISIEEVAAKAGLDATMLYRTIRFTAGFGVFREEESGIRMAHTDQSLSLRRGGAVHNKVLYRLSSEIVL